MSGKGPAEIARELEIPEATVRCWKRRYQWTREKPKRKMKELHDITEALDQLERKDSESIKFATLLRLRYVYGYDWERIATDMSYSEDYVKRRLHSLALTAFEPVVNNQTCS